MTPLNLECNLSSSLTFFFLSGYHIAKGEKGLKDLELLIAMLTGINIMKPICCVIILKSSDSNVHTSEVIHFNCYIMMQSDFIIFPRN